MSTTVAWKKLAQVGPITWSDFAPWRAARAALGVTTPLALGWASGHLEFGAYTALGAMAAGFASFQGETRSRVTVVGVASVGMAVSTFVGATCAGTPWLLVPAVAAWGYMTGLTVCLGQRANVAVLQWAVALLIAIGLPLGAREAAVRAGFVLAGGMFQAVLVAASWTLNPGAHERTALAATYRALAGYAARLAVGDSGPPPPAAFSADSPLDDPNPILSKATRRTLASLLEEAERIRMSLAALATRPPGDPDGSAEAFAQLVAETTSTLNLAADVLAAVRNERTGLLRKLRGYAHLTIAADAPWRWAGEALLGQLRTVARLVVRLETVPSASPQGGAQSFRSYGHDKGGLVAAITTLRANVTTTSEPGRHALRLAVVTALAELVVLSTGLYQGRWVVLTILIVLKPDYGTTLYRGVQRVVGTLLGVGLGLAVAQLTSLGHGGLVAAAGVSIAVAYALFNLSYLLFAVFLTAFIVILLELLGIPAAQTTAARFLNTFLGAALALVAYRTWPTWEGATAHEKFAGLLEAHRDYVVALLRELVDPGSVGSAQLRARRTAARRMRSDSEAATERLKTEPVQAALTPRLAKALIAAVARLAHAELALHALAVSPKRTHAPPGAFGDIAKHVDDLRVAIDVTMRRQTGAIQSQRPPSSVPALRPIQAALHADATPAAAPFLEIANRLVDAVNTVEDIVGEIGRQRVHPKPKTLGPADRGRST